ncbi:outer membrane usher protein [Serratia fonticola]|uniref:outer membrane usher protein n=1 Tax=Serratia fonticola TaxID=47917 RepID=UPI0016480EC9|nr:outer membrane usher protein [Serratia fonticola]MBC3248943.1 outer membrane usher protein [Serratia fonticola]
MKLLSTRKLASNQVLRLCIFLALSSMSAMVFSAEDVEFNTDMLDVNDRKNIDMSQFSRSGFIMPGTYGMVVRINRDELPEQLVSFYAPEGEAHGSRACVDKAMVERFGLKEGLLDKLTWWHQGECLNESSLQGMEVRGDLSTSALYLSIPQAYLEYTSESWEPPSRWENGIPGLLLDYNLNGRMQRQQTQRGDSYGLSGNGTAGMNLGVWRLRADWQGSIDQQNGSARSKNSQFDWDRYYAYRAIKMLRSKLMIGENYLDSDLFDSFRFSGASLVSDDSMQPPNLRGYAPEIVGVARTNARVIISQQGWLLHETQVAAGPFRIQDINDAVNGELHVRVEEQDGSVQEFNLNTASIPYLTRPGVVRFKLSAGKPSDWQHHVSGPWFGTGEFSWGINSGWSLYGGVLTGGGYNAASLGIGRDLMVLGALSFDATQSMVRVPQQDSMLMGGSYRLSYSKRFDEYDSQVTFAGYRFSQRDFMNMSDYVNMNRGDKGTRNNKEMYTISFNKQFRDAGITLYLNYDHQTYWGQSANDRYNLMLSRYFDIGVFRNISLSLSAYRNRYNGMNDDGAYLSLSLPWGNNATVSYNTTTGRETTTNKVSYYEKTDELNNYQVSVGHSCDGGNLSGYYNHEGDMAQITANASYHQGSYSALGMSAQGGATLTAKGGALHRMGIMGSTRLLIDTQGVPGVPVRGYGSTSRTNTWGKTVIGDINSYYRNEASIDLNLLGENAEVPQSVVQATLTEGAIGYRQFDVVAGQKAMAVIRLADGREPPFGASVMNTRRQETGIVSEGGNVYLSGINPGESMTVHWNGNAQCEVSLPAELLTDMLTNPLLLPCHLLGASTASSE